MYPQSYIYKNIPVSFDFITTSNQGVFLWSSCIFSFRVQNIRFYVQNSLLSTIQSFLPICFPSVHQQQLDTLQVQSDCLFINLEKILQTGVRVACVKNRNVTANPSLTGTGATNLVTLFTIFGPTKLISSSKFAGAICIVH